MSGIAEIADYILDSNEVTVCRVKDRFTKPSSAGWADLMLNFYLNDDPARHVCEVQIIHFKMLSQRTTQEGHGAYNVFRSASELLIKTKRKQKNSLKKLGSKKFSSKKLIDANTTNTTHAKVHPLDTNMDDPTQAPPTN